MFSKYPVGTVVDVLDTTDIFCPAIVKKNNGNSVFVSYVGWDSEWDEKIVDSDRIAFNKTRKVKAWVRLYRKICVWPCVLYIRTPLKGSSKAIEYLRDFENKVFTMPCGPNTGLLKPYNTPQGSWVPATSVYPFQKNFESRMNAGKSSKLCSQFEAAVNELLSNTAAIEYKFSFQGSLDIGSLSRLQLSNLELPSGGDAESDEAEAISMKEEPDLPNKTSVESSQDGLQTHGGRTPKHIAEDMTDSDLRILASEVGPAGVLSNGLAFSFATVNPGAKPAERVKESDSRTVPTKLPSMLSLNAVFSFIQHLDRLECEGGEGQQERGAMSTQTSSAYAVRNIPSSYLVPLTSSDNSSECVAQGCETTVLPCGSWSMRAFADAIAKHQGPPSKVRRTSLGSSVDKRIVAVAVKDGATCSTADSALAAVGATTSSSTTKQPHSTSATAQPVPTRVEDEGKKGKASSSKRKSLV